MKTILTSVILLFFIAAQAQQGYDIKVHIEGLTDSVAYLGYYYGDKQYVKDTSRVTNGSVVFQGKDSLDQGLYFFYAPESSAFFDVAMGADQRFSISTNTSDYVKNMVVDGSEENKLLQEYKVTLAENQQKANQLREQIEANKEDQAKSEELKSQMMSINEKVVAFQQDFVKTHPESMVAVLINITQTPEVREGLDQTKKFYYYRDHFFDKVDFSDPRILRTPVFHPKLIEFVEKMTMQQPDSIAKAASSVVEKAKANDQVFRYAVITYTSKYESSEIMGMDAVFVDLAEKYYMSGLATWADSTVLANITEKVVKTKPNLIGKTIKPMVLYDTLMRPARIPSGQSKYTVLYFFSPDCGHCKKSTPKLKELLPKIKAQGAEVIGVCTMIEMDKFKEFLQEYEPNWKNYADLQYQRKPFNVETTPMVYVLDKNNKIIAKRIDLEKIEGFLEHQNKMSTPDNSLGRK
ncbi:MAG: thioredoxin-like domain-containing protein [Candidatus Cyclobacteriaceae bacterium M3_2C_046]